MQRLSAEQAAALVRAQDSLGIPLGPGQPKLFLHALGERDDYRDLRVFGALLIDFFRLFTRPGVVLRSGFFGPVERGLRDAGHSVDFVPADFRRFERIARDFAPRVVATAAAPPDEGGRLSLSLHAGATVAEIERAARDPERLLVVETSPRLPRTLGLPPEHPHSVALSEVDVWIEGDAEPFALAEATPGETDRAIAEHVRRFVCEGATLQTGIGAVPNEVVTLLSEGPGGDYGVHSEMFTTGLMRLHQSGKVSNRKGIYDGISVSTFALGTRELYDWLDGREEVRFLPVRHVNSGAEIRRNRNMISINGALAVDLAGQVAADAIGHREYSGIGGHEDFVLGAALAEGRSLICLPSTVSTGGQRRSRIVAGFPPGALVTTPRHQVDVIVTEFGAAELAGRTVEERARALLEIVHPDFRAEIEADAARLERG